MCSTSKYFSPVKCFILCSQIHIVCLLHFNSLELSIQVLTYQSYLEIDNPDYVLNKIKSELIYFVADVFESLSRQFMFKYKFPFAIEKCGRWWDKNNKIDVVGIGGNNIIFGECKWSKKHIGLNILNELKAKSKNVIWGEKNRNEYFILFSKSGFSKDIIEYEKRNDNLFLIDADKF